MQSPCPGGKYCQGHDSSLEPLECPPGFYCPPEQSNLSLAQTVFSVIEAPQNLPRAQKVALALIPQYRIVRVEMQASILTACDKKITQVFEQP